MPPDRAHVLQFAAGQKIVGVEFPARYGGEWAVGWADHARGAFLVEGMRLVPPSRGEEAVMRSKVESGMCFLFYPSSPTVLGLKMVFVLGFFFSFRSCSGRKTVTDGVG
jgi:hypothetical protein